LTDREDRAALAGRVAALEKDHDPAAALAHIVLQLDEFHLKGLELLFIELVLHRVVIGVVARFQRVALDPVRQDRVV
jgi:hypothetical protein